MPVRGDAELRINSCSGSLREGASEVHRLPESRRESRFVPTKCNCHRE